MTSDGAALEEGGSWSGETIQKVIKSRLDSRDQVKYVPAHSLIITMMMMMLKSMLSPRCLSCSPTPCSPISPSALTTRG